MRSSPVPPSSSGGAAVPRRAAHHSNRTSRKAISSVPRSSSSASCTMGTSRSASDSSSWRLRRRRVVWLGRDHASIPTADPVGDKATVLVSCLLPCEMAGVEWMGLAIRKKIVEVLVIRPRHEFIVATGHDLRRRRDRREQVTQDRILLRVVPHEPCRLGEASEVVGTDVILVDFWLALAACACFDRVADVRPGVERTDGVQAGRRT